MISDQAVEEAAHIIWAGTTSDRWTSPSDEESRWHLRLARSALESAAPLMLAEAWREGCAEGIACDWDKGAEHLPLNPYRNQP